MADVQDDAREEVVWDLRLSDARWRRPVQPTCNTIGAAPSTNTAWRTTGVRRRHRHRPAQPDVGNAACGRPVLRVCCTAADSIKIVDRLRAASGRSERVNEGVLVFRIKIMNGDEHYTSGSVVTQGTKIGPGTAGDQQFRAL
jgi:hypothetical protein